MIHDSSQNTLKYFFLNIFFRIKEKIHCIRNISYNILKTDEIGNLYKGQKKFLKKILQKLKIILYKLIK